MRLNEEELALITKVRDMMCEDFKRKYPVNSDFICWNLLIAHHEGDQNSILTGDLLEVQMEKVGGACKRVWLAIESGLEGRYTMDGYLAGLWVAHDLNLGDPEGYCTQMARLAWLDRMIETGEIK